MILWFQVQILVGHQPVAGFSATERNVAIPCRIARFQFLAHAFFGNQEWKAQTFSAALFGRPRLIPTFGEFEI